MTNCLNCKHGRTCQESKWCRACLNWISNPLVRQQRGHFPHFLNDPALVEETQGMIAAAENRINPADGHVPAEFSTGPDAIKIVPGKKS